MKLFALLLALVGIAAASDVQVVNGWTDCGSVGRVLALDVTDCENTPCPLVPGRSYDIIVDFISTVRITQVNLKINVVTETGVINLFDVSVEGNIQPNEPYNLGLALPVTNQFAGRTIALQFELFDYNTADREICISALCEVSA